MRNNLTLVLLLLSRLCFSNMASPFNWGTIGSNAFSSADLQILKEKIHVTIDKDFKTAYYEIDYIIKSDVHGVQIPLLFYAEGYRDSFNVYVDNENVKLLPVPDNVRTSSNTPYNRFSKSFRSPSIKGDPESVTIMWSEHGGFSYPISDLKYFYANLLEGEHRIHVTYTANYTTTDLHNGAEYSFVYSLAPAEHWRSFGSLEITVDASRYGKAVETNLGPAVQGRTDSIATWHFNKIPAEFFEVYYFAKSDIQREPYPSVKTFDTGNKWFLTVTGSIIILVLSIIIIWFLKRSKK
jgi:hypothetical protein